MLTNSNKIYNYLTNTMGFTKADIGEALSVQGLNTFDDLLMFSDDDLQTLCDRIRKGSGLVANPTQTSGNRSTMPAQIKDPGVTIGWVHELKLQKLRYIRFHFNCIQRPFSAASRELAADVRGVVDGCVWYEVAIGTAKGFFCGTTDRLWCLACGEMLAVAPTRNAHGLLSIGFGGDE